MSFETTVWSQILDAAHGGGRTDDFVTRYRPPLLRFLARRGLQAADAEDVAQEVFARLFTQDLLVRADASRSRFRTFLCGITLRVLSERRRRASALKRGGAEVTVPLAAVPEPAALAEFDRCWGAELLRGALDALASTRPQQHAVLQLVIDERLAYAEIAARLDRGLSAVKMDVSRARRYLAQWIEREIRGYCSSQAEFAEELSAFRSLTGAARRDR